MNVRDDILLTWLTAFRLDCGADATEEFYMPSAVQNELIERGWLERRQFVSPDTFSYHVTDAGCTASDLFAPESGVDSIGATVC